MRPIKFRAWYNEKELLEVDSLYFPDKEAVPFAYLRGSDGSRFGQGQCTVIFEEFTGEKCYVTHSDLYEGDIMERNLELFVIVYKHGSFVCQSIENPNVSYSLSLFTSVTSIGDAGATVGNIHENKKRKCLFYRKEKDIQKEEE